MYESLHKLIAAIGALILADNKQSYFLEVYTLMQIIYESMHIRIVVFRLLYCMYISSSSIATFEEEPPLLKHIRSSMSLSVGSRKVL